MKVLTIGGGTQDVYLRYEGADTMLISHKHIEQSYMIFKSDTKIEVEELCYFTGGGSTNSAVSFQRLGFQATCFCKVGNDNPGAAISANLAAEGVQTECIVTTNNHPSGQSFVLNSLKGERTIFAFRGANGHLTTSEIPLTCLAESAFVYITSLSHDSALILPDIVKLCKERSIPVAINPGTSQLTKGTATLKDSLPFIDTFILNSAEARIFMTALIETDSYYERALECLEGDVLCSPDLLDRMPNLLRGPIPHENIFLNIRSFFKEILSLGTKTVVVTDGKYGVYVAHGDTIYFYPSIKTEVVDTLGAGDSFGSCFVGCRLQGDSIPDALRYGIVNSSSVISHFGAKPGLLTKAELQKQAKKAPLDRLQTFKL